MDSPGQPNSPATMVLEYLESHETIQVKQVRELCDITWDNDARLILRSLENRQLIQRGPKARKGGVSYTKGRLFAKWRDFQDNGFQTNVLTGDQFEIPGLLRPRMPGLQ